MKQLLLCSLTAIAVLTGCATSYTGDGFSGGYSEIQLDTNVFRVSFRGNGYTRPDKVSDFTLLRSAELAIDNGYSFFVIIDRNSYASTSSHATTSTTKDASVNVYKVGDQEYGSAKSTTTGGQTYSFSKPSSSNTIICFEEKPPAGFSYNAKFIYKSLTEKYNLNEEGS